MSMSDCEKCWDTPCTCGYDYIYEAPRALRAMAQLLLDVAVFNEVEPANPEERFTMKRIDRFERFKTWKMERAK